MPLLLLANCSQPVGYTRNIRGERRELRGREAFELFISVNRFVRGFCVHARLMSYNNVWNSDMSMCSFNMTLIQFTRQPFSFT